MKRNTSKAMAVGSTMTGLALLALVLFSLVACEKKADPAPTAASAPKASEAPKVEAKVERVEIPEVRVKPGKATAVKVRWVTPNGTAVNDDAPFRVRWNRSDGLAEAPADVKSSGNAVKEGFSVDVHPLAPNSTLAGEISIVVCDSATHSVCVPVKRAVELGFLATKDAADDATVSIPLPSAR